MHRVYVEKWIAGRIRDVYKLQENEVIRIRKLKKQFLQHNSVHFWQPSMDHLRHPVKSVSIHMKPPKYKITHYVYNVEQSSSEEHLPNIFLFRFVPRTTCWM